MPDQNDQTLQNPRDINAFFVIISEAKIQIDCLNKMTKKSKIKTNFSNININE